MPYIKDIKRKEFEEAGIEDIAEVIEGPGDLNYVISYMAKSMINNSDRPGSYSELSSIRAAINDASDEFYRRVLVPLEDRKIRENGDVYE